MSRPLTSLACWAALFACGACTSAHAAGSIYVATGADGMPSYTDVPGAARNTLYLVLRDPPRRPKALHNTSARLATGATARVAHGRAASPEIRNLVVAAARTYKLSPELLLAVMHAESNFDPAALSSAGATGLMQIMPLTGARYGVRQGLADPANNVDVGARYLKDLLTMFSGDMALALAAYNAGEGAVLRNGNRIPPYAETLHYVPRVLALYQNYMLASLGEIQQPHPIGPRYDVATPADSQLR